VKCNILAVVFLANGFSVDKEALVKHEGLMMNEVNEGSWDKAIPNVAQQYNAAVTSD
jgi:hypothetical protein